MSRIHEALRKVQFESTSDSLRPKDQQGRLIKFDVREDEEQEDKRNEIMNMLVSGGYYRALNKNLTDFDKIVGGLCWCLSSRAFELDVSQIFKNSLTIGDKMAVTEKITEALEIIGCPIKLLPHEIQGLNFIRMYPVIQWLISRLHLQSIKLNPSRIPSSSTSVSVSLPPDRNIEHLKKRNEELEHAIQSTVEQLENFRRYESSPLWGTIRHLIQDYEEVKRKEKFLKNEYKAKAEVLLDAIEALKVNNKDLDETKDRSPRIDTEKLKELQSLLEDNMTSLEFTQFHKRYMELIDQISLIHMKAKEAYMTYNMNVEIDAVLKSEQELFDSLLNTQQRLKNIFAYLDSSKEMLLLKEKELVNSLDHLNEEKSNLKNILASMHQLKEEYSRKICNFNQMIQKCDAGRKCD